MIKLQLREGRRDDIVLKALLLIAICTVMAVMNPVRGQDDSQAPPPPADAAPPQDGGGGDDSGASFQTFYDSLQSQGTWIQSNDYGYVWQPNVNDPNWAPYTDGSWAYTDDGWTWDSNEPWGWATYHYGRWVNLDGTGWCWVPGYTWAPAWVSWRYGDGYCGWAPLPPDSFVGIDYGDGGVFIGIGFHIGGDCDNFYGIGAGCYHFIPVHCMGYHDYHHYYADHHDNYAIINHTTNVTNINVTNINVTHNSADGGSFGGRKVTIGGPSLAQVNAVSETPVPRVDLVRTNQPGGGGLLGDHTLTLYVPHFNPATRETARPGTIAGSIGQATVNRGLDITRPLAVNSRLPVTPPSGAQIEQARLAQSQAPANAKIATAGMQVNPVLNEPLTSLKPISTERPSSEPDVAPRTTEEAPAENAPHVYNGQAGSSSQAYPSAPGYSSAPPSSAPVHPSGGSTPTPYHPSGAPAGYPSSGGHPSGGGYSSGGYHGSGGSYHGGGGGSGGYGNGQGNQGH